MVFTDENYVNKQLARKTRANPPPNDVNTEMMMSIREQDDNVAEGENLHTSTKASGFSEPLDYKKAAAVMKEIEEKVYVGGLPRGGTFQSVFRQIFDCDGDGFVSHADFEGACRKLQVQADTKSILHAVRALDTE